MFNPAHTNRRDKRVKEELRAERRLLKAAKAEIRRAEREQAHLGHDSPVDPTVEP